MLDTIEYGLVPPQALAGLAGLDFLQGIIAGNYPQPPIARTTGIHLVHAEPGLARFAGTPGVAHYNPMGTVHGGWSATLLDSATACAILSTLPKGRGFTTLELKVNFVRAITERTGEVVAVGRVVHAGRRVATAEGRLTDATGALLAHATTTCLIVEP
jgi:uncharacterized protein (TIGR00369 family)